MAGERGDEVGGRGRGEHDEVTRLAVLGQHARGVGLHELDQLRRGELAGAAHRLDGPSPREMRGGAHHGHEGQALAHEVVEPVEEALAGQRPPSVEEPLGVHGRAQDEAARPRSRVRSRSTNTAARDAGASRRADPSPLW